MNIKIGFAMFKSPYKQKQNTNSLSPTTFKALDRKNPLKYQNGSEPPQTKISNFLSQKRKLNYWIMKESLNN